METHVMIAPDHLDFGPLPVGCGSREREICIYNTRPAEVTLREVAFSGDTPGVFSLHGLPAGLGEPGVVVDSGRSVCFGVRFEAETIASYQGQIAITLEEIDHPFMAALFGSGDSGPDQTERFEQPAQAMADVLFVIQAGGYMELEWLGDHIGVFFDIADRLGVDYHVGIIYSDGRDAHGGGVLRPLDRSRPHILTPSTPDAAATFRDNVGLLYSGANWWHFLWSTEKALHPSYLSDPQLNAGFLRPEAHLSLVYVVPVSADGSHHFCGFLEGAPDCGTTDYYLGAFMRAKGFRADRLSIHGAIVPPSATRINELIERTGGLPGLTGEGESALPDHLAELAPHAFGYRTRFFLENQPHPDTLDVHIITTGGQRLPATDWSYDPEANAIDFEPTGLPEPGQTVEVTYQVVCA